MGFFSRNKTTIDESVDDQTWIRQGYQRFDRDKGSHFGSPETMRAGGDEAAGRGDLAAAIFYYGKAADIAQTWSSSKPGERPTELDIELFETYATGVETIRTMRPGADLSTDWANETARYALPMMVSVARTRHGAGEPTDRLFAAIDRVAAATGLEITN
jgi:hypothetical protein